MLILKMLAGLHGYYIAKLSPSYAHVLAFDPGVYVELKCKEKWLKHNNFRFNLKEGVKAITFKITGPNRGGVCMFISSATNIYVAYRPESMQIHEKIPRSFIRNDRVRDTAWIKRQHTKVRRHSGR